MTPARSVIRKSSFGGTGVRSGRRAEYSVAEPAAAADAYGAAEPPAVRRPLLGAALNSYQKAGTWVMRLVGAVITAGGVMGTLWAGIAHALGVQIQEYSAERWLGSAMWAIGGVVLVLASKPIGRLLGRGLE
jgi:hypothetical protein